MICGGGEGVWVEREEALDLLAVVGAEPVSLAINEAGIYHPDPLDHWVSLHPDKLVVEPNEWALQRERNGGSPAGTVWSVTRLHSTVDRTVRNWNGGSSGLLATDAAVNGLGLSHVILCGVPIDARPNEFKGEPWAQFERFQAAWKRAQPKMAGRVRSMSGWTRELLGSPTLDWLEQEQAA